MGIFELSIIIGLVVVWYGLVPLAGTLVSRHLWRLFRRRFNELQQAPVLGYETLCAASVSAKPVAPDSAKAGTSAEEAVPGSAAYRFTGTFESLSDGVIWVRSDSLMVPVNITGTYVYMLPSLGKEVEPDEEFERVRWDRIPAIAQGAKVFVAGAVAQQAGRPVFASNEETPLLVIFYDAGERPLAEQVIRAGRNKNAYWTPLAPYSFIMGVFCLIIMAISYLQRPAFRLTALASFIALFIPLFSFFPPGVLLTVLYRNLWRQSQVFGVYRDMISAGEPEKTAERRRYAVKAVVFELLARFSLFLGIAVNVYFIGLILSILL
jgi:hypothetical protein